MDAPARLRPPGLVVACIVTAVEGLLLTGFGGWLAYQTVVGEASNERVAAGSASYFLVFGPLVLLVGWALWRGRSFAHGAALFVQLIAVPVAWTMWQGGFVVGALILGLAAVAAIVGLLQRETRAALGRT